MTTTKTIYTISRLMDNGRESSLGQFYDKSKAVEAARDATETFSGLIELWEHNEDTGDCDRVKF